MNLESGRDITSRGMRFSSRGSGRPILFLHGWCLNSAMWTYAEEHFAGQYQVITPDLPGFGRSVDVSGPLTLDGYGEHVATLVREEKLRDVVIVGFAFGAAVALAAAALLKDLVAEVISVGMPDPAATPYDRMPKSMRRDWPGFARRSAESLLIQSNSEATISWLERMFGSAPLVNAIETCAVLQSLDAPSLAARVEARQVFIHSTADGVAPVAFGEACVRAAPSGEIRIIQGAGHLMVIDDKAAFHEVLASELAAGSNGKTGSV